MYHNNGKIALVSYLQGSYGGANIIVFWVATPYTDVSEEFFYHEDNDARFL
jgi:hypothetical protein